MACFDWLLLVNQCVVTYPKGSNLATSSFSLNLVFNWVIIKINVKSAHWKTNYIISSYLYFKWNNLKLKTSHMCSSVCGSPTGWLWRVRSQGGGKLCSITDLLKFGVQSFQFTWSAIRKLFSAPVLVTEPSLREWVE